MSLSQYPYVYVTDEKSFHDKWSSILNFLHGKSIAALLLVWDCIENRHFEDAPILIVFSDGTLFVKVSCEDKISLGWNEISPNEKPHWFDAEDSDAISELGWEEDLTWKEWDGTKAIIGKNIIDIKLLKVGNELHGLHFLLEDLTAFEIHNIGDAINII